ncbi:MAG: cob(I)yrinic acid a,c-diamide adenosyltransferase [bacterium]
MGNRLSKIYTRTGDDGTTGLGDGQRIEKDSARVTAYGTVDELNSVIGMTLAHTLPENIQQTLTLIQHQLFNLGGELCMPGTSFIEQKDIHQLEQVLDYFNAKLPALKDFILPGGGLAGSSCHLARTVCRRAEREVITLARVDQVRAESIAYLNRLSDLLFVIARVLGNECNRGEALWNKHHSSLTFLR